jgi:hypothetical protein
MSRGIRLSILIAAGLAVLAVGVTTASGAKPKAKAQAAKTCFFRSRNYHYSYLTYLAVSHTSCDTGRFVAHNHGHVSGWSCHKTITAKGKAQYDADVSCRKGARHVVWSFTQNT